MTEPSNNSAFVAVIAPASHSLSSASVVTLRVCYCIEDAVPSKCACCHLRRGTVVGVAATVSRHVVHFKDSDPDHCVEDYAHLVNTPHNSHSVRCESGCAVDHCKDAVLPCPNVCLVYDVDLVEAHASATGEMVCVDNP